MDNLSLLLRKNACYSQCLAREAEVRERLWKASGGRSSITALKRTSEEQRLLPGKSVFWGMDSPSRYREQLPMAME